MVDLYLIKDILMRINVEPGSRGEELDLEKLIELSNEISDYLSSQRNSVQL
jgi:hypothetical protein